MPPRPIGTGNISFGLVSIPVKLYSTSESSTGVRFNMLRAEDGTRVKQQFVSAVDGEVVRRDQLTKGYEFAKGQYVTFTDEELKSLSEKASPAIEITEFVPVDQVDPLHYDKAYYLGPEEGGARAYRLLGEAMRLTGRVALAKYAARGKMYLVMLRPFDQGLVMQQLKFADEIRAFDEDLLGEDGELKQGEIDLAVQLIDQIAADEFHPEQYHDEVRERILEAIELKVEGEEITAMVEEEPKAQIIDLMQALKASLGEAGRGDAREEKEDRKPARSSPRRSGDEKKAAGGKQ
jgi:DNA end-binding protein Ku